MKQMFETTIITPLPNGPKVKDLHVLDLSLAAQPEQTNQKILI